MFITFPFILGVFFVVPDVLRDDAAASRQQTSPGLVTAYEPSNHNRCRYTFIVQGKQYSGMSSAPATTLSVGDRILVYFDSRDPTTNALEAFSTKSHRDKGFVSFLIIGIFAVAAFILYSKASSKAEHTIP
jgi:hypothetical protein